MQTSLSKTRRQQVKVARPAHPENNQKINDQITQNVIALQAKGFDLDFQILGGKELICIQNNVIFEMGQLEIKVVDQGYDELSRSSKYIHSVETFQGLRGILLSPKRFDNCGFAT